MFHKYNKCIGVPLFFSEKLYIELWFCLPKAIVEEHYHEKQDNIIIFIFGSAKFFKRYSNKTSELHIDLNFKGIFKKFIIERRTYHRFINGNLPLIFLNIAKFTSKYRPVSASKDIIFTK